MNLLRYCASAVVGLTLVFSGLGRLHAQQAGCTDPQALNYNAAATVNDGSCSYPYTAASLPVFIYRLSTKVHENSGLIYWRNSLWTHNDSGGEAKIYRLDTLKGRVGQTIEISNAKNVDWEDIAQDNDYIYIGDMGNNVGNRTNLCIYKIPKSAIPEHDDAAVMAEIIHFSYADQMSKKPAIYKHNFDCEAMLVYEDNLLLFSKNWNDLKSRVYQLPKTPGNYVVEPLNTLDVDGLITGADLSPDGKTIALCGYKDYEPFLFLIYDFVPDDIFAGNKRRIAINGKFGVQTEGITFFSSNRLLISAEKTAVAPARIYYFYHEIYSGHAVANP